VKYKDMLRNQIFPAIQAIMDENFDIRSDMVSAGHMQHHITEKKFIII